MSDEELADQDSVAPVNGFWALPMNTRLNTKRMSGPFTLQ